MGDQPREQPLWSRSPLGVFSVWGPSWGDEPGFQEMSVPEMIPDHFRQSVPQRENRNEPTPGEPTWLLDKRCARRSERHVKWIRAVENVYQT